MLIKPGVDEKIECKSAEELLLALSPANPCWNGKPSDWLFRGHGDSRCRLVPKALRADPIPRLDLSSKKLMLKKTHAEQVRAEWTLLWEFFRVANQQGISIPEDSQLYRSPDLFVQHMKPEYKKALDADRAWPLENLLSLAALAQHYGVATRLLDWSTKPLVAAYFAAKGQTCASGQGPVSISVWCLNWRYVWKVWPAKKAAKTKNVEYVLLVTAPRASNANLHAQGGAFTVDRRLPANGRARIRREALDDIVSSTYDPKVAGGVPVMREFVLAVDQVPALFRLLSDHGVSAASIYPGLEGVAKSLDERTAWDVPPGTEFLPL
jgi:hypothetical protein